MPGRTELCDQAKTYRSSVSTDPCNTACRRGTDLDTQGKMNRSCKSLVFETVYQLCSRNKDLDKTGITYKQLHTVLSLRLSRGTTASYITVLIEQEIEAKTIIKNHLGNFIMNPDPDSALIPEESSSDSSAETKETDSTATEQTVDLSDILESKKSYEIVNIKNEEKPNLVGSMSQSASPERMEVEESDVDKPMRRRRRRTRKPKVIEEEPEEEPDTPERSPSPPPQTKRTGCSVLVTNSNGRRIIRKITKYDPSEFYLTPLIRKRSKGVVEEPKVKLKRGRPPSVKAKLAAAAAAATIASTSSAPLKKLEQLRREAKNCKLAPEQDKTTDNEKSSEPTPEVDTKEDFLEEEIQIPMNNKSSMLRNECYLCLEAADVNDDKTILACSLCLNIAHKNCVVDDGFYKELKKWRCSHCLINNPVVCSVCDKEYKKSDGVMVMCDFCEEMFHVNCHVPPIKLPVSGYSWRCSLCPQVSVTDTLIGAREDLKSAVGTFAFSATLVKPQSCVGSAYVPGPASSQPAVESNQEQVQTPPEEPTVSVSLPQPIEIKMEPPDEEMPKQEDKKDERPPSYKFHRPGEPIPKVDDWTPKQVADYFSERFGPVVGNAFLLQEIDGRSLKLMRRNDVTEQLGLQFGIALKVLYYVKKIQLNTNVIQELWT